MKRTISILSLMLGLLVSTLAFTACGSDNDSNEFSNIQNSKHIVKMIGEIADADDYLLEEIYSYDSLGRVVKVVLTEFSEKIYHEERTYQYGESIIITKEVNNRGWSGSHTYILKNGRIVKDVEEEDGSTTTITSSYSYDSNGYLTSISESGSIITSKTIKIEWAGGNITSVDGFESTFTNIPWNEGLFIYYLPNMDKCLWASGYWGKIPKNVPSQDIDKIWTFNYETSNGLVTKRTGTRNTPDYKSIITFVWE